MAEDDDSGGGWGKGFTYGLEIVVGITLGCLIGRWWDNHHQTGPWGMLIGMMIGFAAGMYLLLKDFNRMNKD
jgi:ATP synthase protein I